MKQLITQDMNSLLPRRKMSEIIYTLIIELKHANRQATSRLKYVSKTIDHMEQEINDFEEKFAGEDCIPEYSIEVKLEREDEPTVSGKTEMSNVKKKKRGKRGPYRKVIKPGPQKKLGRPVKKEEKLQTLPPESDSPLSDF